MAAPSPQNMRRLKGKLLVATNASDFDLTAAYPYGGTEMGLCRSAAFVWGIKYAPIQCEEFGGIATEFMYLSETAVLSAVLREYDDDMIKTVFHSSNEGMNGTTGKKVTVSGKPVVRAGLSSKVATSGIGNTYPGQIVSALHKSILFVPDDTENHEFLLMYNAMPMVQEASDMKMTAAEWAEVGVVFHAIPDSTGKLYEFGRITDIPIA